MAYRENLDLPPVVEAAVVYVEELVQQYDWSHANPLSAEFQQGFQFDALKTPLAQFEISLPVTAVYILSIIVFRILMNCKSTPLYVPQFVKNIHNFILSAGSLAMFVGITVGVLLKLKANTAQDPAILLVCDEQTQTMQGVLGFWCYVYFLSKYYELIDTFLIVAAKKNLTFLHFFHHAIIGPMSLSWLHAGWQLQWIGAWLNTCVHVFMYGYYLLKALYNYNPWWKKYITTGQILQFFLVFIMIWTHLYFALEGKYDTIVVSTLDTTLYSNPITIPWLTLSAAATANKCSGNLTTVAFSQAVNCAFLVLFINFYIQTYTKKKSKRKTA